MESCPLLAISNTRLTFIKDTTMLKIHFANKTFTYLNEYMTFNQTIYNNYIFLLYLSQLQKLTVACYSFFMKNFDYRCNNIFVLVTITKKQLAVAVINLFYFINFRRRGAFFACVSFTWRVTDLFFAVFLLCYFVG